MHFTYNMAAIFIPIYHILSTLFPIIGCFSSTNILGDQVITSQTVHVGRSNSSEERIIPKEDSNDYKVYKDSFLGMESQLEVQDDGEGKGKHLFLVPFDWHYLQNLNGTPSMKLRNCCHKEHHKKHFCLKSPLPVCPTGNQCSYFRIDGAASNRSMQNLLGCCCDIKAGPRDGNNQEDMLINVKEVRTTHVSRNSCACLLMGKLTRELYTDRISNSGIEEQAQNVNGKTKAFTNEAEKAIKIFGDKGRAKRSTLSNPMIYPTFRHINERKRMQFSNPPNVEMKMQMGANMGNGNWSSQASSGFNYDDFRRRRSRREIHVMMTRYRKEMRRSHKRSRKSNTRRPKYFTTTPLTFLNVSFTGYTEKRTTTTTKKPSSLKMSEKDLEFVYGKKKKEPRFEAIIGGPTSQLKIRVE